MKREQPVYDMPEANAAHKEILKAGDVVSILASFNNYYFVRTQGEVAGWIDK